MIILRAMHKVYILSVDAFAFHWRKLAFHQKKVSIISAQIITQRIFFANVFYYSINLVSQYVLDL